ncbi:RNA polymerase sigma factor [Patescibacteria group bacterium]|nr:RNA polymerase sigma factor [Patescibacteria group bacterium]
MNFDFQKDPEFIRKLKKGDLRIFEKILFLYEKEIFRHIRRLVPRQQDAEDLTQETFIKVYRHIGTLDPTKGMKSWIYKIATNTAYDWFRKNKRNRELFIIDNAGSPFETIDEHSSYTYQERATTKDLQDALERIKPVYKSILLLFYEEGLKYGEIAEILSLPLNTVKTHIRRAKSALVKEFQKNNG